MLTEGSLYQPSPRGSSGRNSMIVSFDVPAQHNRLLAESATANNTSSSKSSACISLTPPVEVFTCLWCGSCYMAASAESGADEPVRHRGLKICWKISGP